MPESTAIQTTAADWLWGIEVECYVNANSPIYRNWRVGGYHHGIQIPGARRGWTVEQDSSVSGNGAYGLAGVEIVSPRCHGLVGLEDLAGTMLAVKEDMGGAVDSHCGQHVHVDGRDFAAGRANDQTLIAGFCRYETDLYWLNGTRAGERLGNAYCSPVYRDNPYSARMQSLNLRNLSGGSRSTTVEYRLWAGCLEPDTAIMQVAVSVALTRHYALGLPDPDEGIGGILAMLEAHPIVPDAIGDLQELARMRWEQGRENVSGRTVASVQSARY